VKKKTQNKGYYGVQGWYQFMYSLTISKLHIFCGFGLVSWDNLPS